MSKPYTGQEAPIDAQGFENALYTIDIGQNDVNGLLSNLPYDQVVAKFPPILAEIKDAVQVNFLFAFCEYKLLYLFTCSQDRPPQLCSFCKICRFCMPTGVGTSGYTAQGL
jgi:hypothetical protein